MWLRLSDEFSDDPRLIEAGGDAGWLHVCALVYAARYATDGRVPKAMISRLTDRSEPENLASRLVELGVWRELGETFELVDYLKWNPPRAEVERIQKSRSQAGRVGAENRWRPKTEPPKPKANAKTLAKPTDMASAKANGKGNGLAKPWLADKDKDKDPATKSGPDLELKKSRCLEVDGAGRRCILDVGHEGTWDGEHDFEVEAVSA